MAVTFAVLFISMFYVFLALGITMNLTKRKAKWPFVLSALGLICTIMMFIIFNWDLEKGKSHTAFQNIGEMKEKNILEKLS